ncbi:hypothetical protein J7438_25535 [Thalassotalea sp. G20_0]|uniref:hypothetical protein n=1 Tax=Thalassotalea sp. G20_0 TaxID=2821093 RepID=UPI001ADC6DEE|nr:hypothetical protein [Thalassotalea sp. G20_0]MBO9497420.1 hypothetical protein [Thalassotalea sp. G20_0]
MVVISRRLYRQSDVGSPTGDFHPISSCPCRAYQSLPADAACGGAAEGGVRIFGEVMKYINKMKQIEITDILKFSSSLEAENPEYTYHKSYRYFVQYFADKSELTEQELMIGANLTYGWMPTIMNFKANNFEGALNILNKAKLAERISTDELLALKSLINNSLVGVSKLLHFVNPDVYAIWDSRVCHFLLGKSYKYIIEKPDLYWEYLNLCERVSKDLAFQPIHNSFENSVRYKVSALRVVEQLMFMNSHTTIVKF